ncbi:winged helix-turn-helix transcriptional regulator [Leptolyngbya sp. KIOST-1]|uniref:winged helix-turn-helix transcriptional regulator n=1 Tax=Leptolyngbya sp. KIOST-1 TaxID=1229172 RepID=UPI000B072272|nr:helix-turn-helix domain-containing protein [Leptolyngbya sp. KIOST-1]
MPHPFNGTKLDCPVHLVLSYIGSKWAILILQELFQGSRRTNEFLSALPGISTKTLTARLRELESYGLVKRTVFPEVPPRVEYSLTAKGREVQPIMAALNQVGQQWLVHSPGEGRNTPSNRSTTSYGPRSR